MTAVELPDAQRIAYGLVLWQAVATLAMAAIAYLLIGDKAALSAAIGGGIVTAASLALALLAFRGRPDDMQSMLRAFYVGEAAKIAVVVTSFVLVLTTMKDSLVPGILFGAYAATFLVHWIGLRRVTSRLMGSI